MKKLSTKVIKIYKKREKAYQALLECDVEIDMLLHELNQKYDTKETKNRR
jgi:hypothetical protein